MYKILQNFAEYRGIPGETLHRIQKELETWKHGDMKIGDMEK
jgi:hypothetical protein